MQNLIIINNDIKYIQNILYATSNSINNLKLYNFFTEKTANLLNILDNNEIDIIILTLNTTGIDILNYLIKNNLKFYKKSIILLYDNINCVKKILNDDFQKYIFKCVKKSNNLSVLLKNLRYIVYIKETTFEKAILESRIERNLLKIGFNKRNVGTKYIIEIIEYLCENKLEKFKLKEVYELLSKKYCKSTNTIKCAIQLARDTMCKKGNKEDIVNYFNFLELEKYPTVMEIISTTIEKL